MNARLRFIVVMTALSVAALAILALPLVTRAVDSPPPSNCCSYVIENHTPCPVAICAEFESVAYDDTTGSTYTTKFELCDTVSMGRYLMGSDAIGDGCTLTKISIMDWDANYYPIPMQIKPCLEGFPVGPKCTARVCYGIDPETGCPVVRVWPESDCKCE